MCFHFNLKEGQCQRMFKLLCNYTHFTCQHGNTHNPSSQPSIVCVPSTTRCTNWIQKRQRNQRSNYQHLLDQRESKGIPEKSYFCFTDHAKAFDCVDHNKLWKILQEMGIPDPLHRGLFADKPVYRSRSNSQNHHGTTDWFKTGQGVSQGCVLSFCLFNLYAEYIM